MFSNVPQYDLIILFCYFLISKWLVIYLIHFQEKVDTKYLEIKLQQLTWIEWPAGGKLE